MEPRSVGVSVRAVSAVVHKLLAACSGLRGCERGSVGSLFQAMLVVHVMQFVKS